MKNTLYILLLLLCTACTNHRPYPALLTAADSLMNIRPDSAVILLQQLKPEMEHANEDTRVYYHLLTVKAADKAYIIHSSDSLIRNILAYYQNKRLSNHLPEALYYAGRVYRDMGDAPQALDYFQQALNALGKEKNPLKSKIYAQMGVLFSSQKIFNEALFAYKSSLEFEIMNKDTIGIIMGLRDIADAYWNLNQPDSVLKYYLDSYELAKKYKKEWEIDRMDFIHMG